MFQIFKSSVKFLIDLPFKKIPVYYIPLGIGLYYATRETLLIATSTWLYNQLDAETERRKNKSENKDLSSKSSDDDSSSDNEFKVKYLNGVSEIQFDNRDFPVEKIDQSTSKSVVTFDKGVNTSFDEDNLENSDSTSKNSDSTSKTLDKSESTPFDEFSAQTSKNISLSSNDASEELSITSCESNELEEGISITEETLDELMNQCIEEELTKQNNNLSWGEWFFGSKDKAD